MLPALLLFCTLIQPSLPSDFTTCARDRSRLVRKRIITDVQPIFDKYRVSIPNSCELSSVRDMYAEQETMKFEEGHNKWVCQYCGKAFYEQRFVDQHFENRHPNFIQQGADVICLSDLCDIFRCDVIIHKNEPKYWDRALCRTNQLLEYQERCISLVKSCIPSSLKNMDKHIFYEELNKTLCSYLTCDQYWILPNQEMHPVSLALYIVATSVLLFGMLVYYYVAYTHFYTDDSLLDDGKQERRRREQEMDPLQYYSPPKGQEIRFRSGVQGARRS